MESAKCEINGNTLKKNSTSKKVAVWKKHMLRKITCSE